MSKINSTKSKMSVNIASTSAIILATCFISTTANAQEEQKSAAAAGPEAYMPEDIIVTAQRRSERVQDVSMAISAFSAESLKTLGVIDVTQLAQLTPNVNIKYAWGNSMPIFTIRGVGMNSFQASDTPSVGLFIDDVFQTSMVTMGPQFFDTERIEVLRGPQGALFGRNTNGGAVSYFSKRPTDTFNASARLDYGSYQRLEFEGAVGGPIGENISGRVSVFTVQQSKGAVTNNLTGADLGEVNTIALRAQLLFTPSSDLSVLLKVFGSRDRSQPQRFQHIGFWNRGATGKTPPANRYCSAFRDGLLNAGVGGTQPATCVDILQYSDADNDPYAGDYTNRRDTPINDAAVLRNDVWGAVLTVEKDFSLGTLTSISAYQHAKRYQPKESDANPKLFLDVVFGSDVVSWSQDIRLTSNDDGPLRWIAGGSAAGDIVEEDPHRDFYTDDYLGFRPTLTYKQDRKAYSIFAQLDADLTDTLTLSGGLRGIRENISFESDIRFLYAPTFLKPGVQVSACPAPQLGLTCKLKSTDYAGRAAVEYRPSSDVMLYASLSRGYKGGGFNGGLVTNALLYRPFLPEIVTAKEVGLKSEFLSRRVTLNLAAFTYDYKGLQAATPRPDPVFGTPLNFLTNLTGASIKGAEADIRFSPSANFDASFSVGWLDTKNDDPGTNFGGAFGNAARILPNAPKFSLATSVNYSVPVSENNLLRFHADYSWSDKHYKEIVNNLQVPANGTMNARVSLDNSSNDVTIAAFVKNIFDTSLVMDTLTDPQISGWGVIVYGQPRTFGVSISSKW